MGGILNFKQCEADCSRLGIWEIKIVQKGWVKYKYYV